MSESEINKYNFGLDFTRKEFDKASSSFQVGKAAGDDQIHIEFIKKIECYPLKNEIFDIIKRMYSTEVFKDFKVSKIVNLSKKLNTFKCKENRTLGFISHASKSLLQIVQGRIRTKAI